MLEQVLGNIPERASGTKEGSNVTSVVLPGTSGWTAGSQLLEEAAGHMGRGDAPNSWGWIGS